jgi:hypothetical protein
MKAFVATLQSTAPFSPSREIETWGRCLYRVLSRDLRPRILHLGNFHLAAPDTIYRSSRKPLGRCFVGANAAAVRCRPRRNNFAGLDQPQTGRLRSLAAEGYVNSHTLALCRRSPPNQAARPGPRCRR